MSRQRRRLGPQVVAGEALGDGAQALGRHLSAVEIAPGQGDRGDQAEQGAVVAARAAAIEQRPGDGQIAALQVQLHQRRQRGGLVVEPGQQLLRLLAAPLSQPQSAEHGQRQRATTATAAIGLALQRLGQDRLRARPVARADEDRAVDATAPRLHRREVAALGELDDRLTPLGGALQVGQAVADHQRRAASVAAGERVVRLTAERHGHRLVEERHALLDATLAHDRPAQLRQGHALDVGVAEVVRDLEGDAGVLLGGGRVAGALGLLDRQPAELGDRALPGQQAPGARQPPCRCRLPAVDPRLTGQVDGDAPGVACVAAALVGGVGIAPSIDARVALTEPPQRLAETIQGVRIARVALERALEGVACRRPVRIGEQLPAGRRLAHPREA